MDSFNVIINFFLQLAECSPEIAALTVLPYLLSDSRVKPEHERVFIAIPVKNFE